ncbi:SGNH/GDSL hydrolase family protein [Sphingomonas sp.]|uniref:SGNH/GDSL hydrolase family protein n=1 Tax=Sphingomonas sp. TaxID=28214 RepID=UPI0035BBD3D1
MRLSRRRFTSGAICALGMPLFLEGCGGGAGAGEAPIGVVPAPMPVPTATPTPVPPPASAPVPPPAPSAAVPAKTISPTAVTIAFAGSSSPERYLTRYDGPVADGAVLASSDGIGFAPLLLGAFGKAAGRTIAATTGRTVRFIRGGVGGSTLAQWAAPGAAVRSDLARKIVAAGGADAVLIQVGWNDAAARIVVGLDTQQALLRTLIAGLRAETGLPDLTVFLGATQGAPGGDDAQHAQLAIQRQVELAVAKSDAGVRYAFSTYDLPTIDAIHQTERSQILSGGRFAAQVVAWLQGSAQRRGPQPLSANPASTTQTDVTIRHVGGSDFTPSSDITGFFVTTPTKVCPIISAVRTSPTTIRLTHGSSEGAAVRVSHALFVESGYDTTVRDNSVDTLPLEPSPGWLPLAA